MANKFLLSFTMLLALPAMALAQAPAKRIYLAPDDHTDYMWALNEEGYRQAFLEMLDYYLDQSDATARNPPEWQSRWNCDGSLWVKIYQENRSPDRFNRLIGRIRDGHITVPLNTLVECYGGQPAEAVLRGMFYAGKLARKYGLQLPLAMAMEDQTLPYGLGALWAGAGARYSWMGICNCATKIKDTRERQREIYWWTGPDGSRILMKWNSIPGSNESIGGYAEARHPAAIVNYLDTSADFIHRYPYNVIGAFGKGWDDKKTLTREFVSVAQSQSNATRQVIVSNECDFFKDFEAKYGAKLPSLSLAFGNEWDTYCASLAEVTARVRRAVEKLRSAEALATLVSLKSPEFMAGRETARDRAWTALGLYWEHDWTADGPVSRADRAAWQRRLADDVDHYIDPLQSDAAAALARMIPAPSPYPRFYVFNALSWNRSDQADLPWTDTRPVKVFEVAGGREVPSQIVSVDGLRRLRVLADAVPPVGYKVYEIRPGVPAPMPDAATVTGSTLENDDYRVTLAGRGAISSLIDKRRDNREFVRTLAGRTMNDLGLGEGQVTVENAGPVSVTLKAVSTSPLRHTTRLTLTRGLPRVAIRNDIEQNFSAVQTWSFGFALNDPDVWHEEVGAVIRAKTADRGGQYSTRNARYDWLTLNHFADISGGGVGLTLANADCSFMRLGASRPGALDTATPQINVLAGGQVDGTNLGIRNQGGDTHFLQRFALTTHGAFDPAQAMRFALEAQNPLLAERIQGGTGYPGDRVSMLEISNPNVILWALKPAEDGIASGVVARIWNLAPRPSEFVLNFADTPIADAAFATHMEVSLGKMKLGAGGIKDTLSSQQLKTCVIHLHPLRSK